MISSDVSPDELEIYIEREAKDASIDTSKPCHGHHDSLEGKLFEVFAKDAVGNLTHPGTSTHTHAVSSEKDTYLTGHVESAGSRSRCDDTSPKINHKSSRKIMNTKLTSIVAICFALLAIATIAHAQEASPPESIEEGKLSEAKDQSSETGGEQSVKPGINKSFVNPELDVDSYVKRFEIESREVFVTRERILTACEIEKGDTVADVGAGTGLFSRMFAVEVGDEGWVYSVDIAPRFIEHINKENAKFDLTNITGVLCAENSVNLPPKSSDVVFVCDTYHHFEYPKSTLASIRRALKDDGHLIVIDFERIEGKTREWLMGHVRAGKEVFLAEILGAGFKLVEEKKINGFEENYFLKFQKD